MAALRLRRAAVATAALLAATAAAAATPTDKAPPPPLPPPPPPPPPHGHACIHDRLKRLHPHLREPTATGGQHYGANHGRALQDATYRPLRIGVQYVGFDAVPPAYAVMAAFVRDSLVPAAVARLSSLLLVTPVAGPLYAHRDCAAYDTRYQPARCTQLEAATDCANFDGEAPIYFSDDQLGADTYYPGAGGGSSPPVTLPAGGGFPDADYVFFVTLRQTAYCGTASTGGVIAYAWGCQRDGGTDRPTIGRANLCPEMMARYTADLPSGVAVVMHEMFHALGFAADSWPLFRFQDAGRTPRTPRSPYFPFRPSADYFTTYACGGNTYGDYVPAGNTLAYFAERGMDACVPGVSAFPPGNCVARLVTPAVKAAAQEFFACGDLPGGEVENDQGGDECATLVGSHWEFRVLAGEMMCPYDVGQRQGFSALTLAMFEDSGWGYKANYSAADRFLRDRDWGYKQGCGLAMGRCVGPDAATGALTGQGSPPHFSPERVTDGSLCRIDRTGYAGANVSDFPSALPTQFQYWPGAPNRGGGDRFGAPSNDYCPMVGQVYGERGCADGHSTAEVADLGMTPGSGALCLSSTLARVGSGAVPRGVGCYRAACTPNGTLHVTITSSGGASGEGECVSAGQQLGFPGFTGAIGCPDVAGLCAPGPLDMTAVVLPAGVWLPATASPAPTATRTPGPPSSSPSPSPVPVVAPAAGAVVVSLCYRVGNASALPPPLAPSTLLALDGAVASALRCDLAAVAGGGLPVASVTVQGSYPASLGAGYATAVNASDPVLNDPAPVCASGGAVGRRRLALSQFPSAAGVRALPAVPGDGVLAPFYSSSFADGVVLGRALVASVPATLGTGICVYASLAAGDAAAAEAVRAAVAQTLYGTSTTLGNAFQRTSAALVASTGVGGGNWSLAPAYVSAAPYGSTSGGGAGTTAISGLGGLPWTTLALYAAAVVAAALFLGCTVYLMCRKRPATQPLTGAPPPAVAPGAGGSTRTMMPAVLQQQQPQAPQPQYLYVTMPNGSLALVAAEPPGAGAAAGPLQQQPQMQYTRQPQQQPQQQQPAYTYAMPRGAAQAVRSNPRAQEEQLPEEAPPARRPLSAATAAAAADPRLAPSPGGGGGGAGAHPAAFTAMAQYRNPSVRALGASATQARRT